MKRKTVLLPKFREIRVPDKTIAVDREDLVRTMKAELRSLPEYVTAFKEADNEGWQEIFDELSEYIQTDPTLMKLVRLKEKNGVQYISIGEPNWALEIIFSFFIGYLFGTGCQKACSPAQVTTTKKEGGSDAGKAADEDGDEGEDGDGEDED